MFVFLFTFQQSNRFDSDSSGVVWGAGTVHTGIIGTQLGLQYVDGHKINLVSFGTTSLATSSFSCRDQEEQKNYVIEPGEILRLLLHLKRNGVHKSG